MKKRVPEVGPASDSALVAKVLGGDRACYRELVSRYERVLFNIALRMLNDADEAKDVAQTVLVKAYQHLGSYDPSRRFFSWIYRIAVNESLRAVERRKPVVPLTDQLASDKASPIERVEREESRQELMRAVHSLDPAYRQVIVLHYFAELSYHDIADTLDIAEKTVKSRLYTARRLLGQRLLKQGMQR